MLKDSGIVVSVFMITYNQENVIGQAIESIMMQRTSFNYQLVIGEDVSSDNTRSICEQYATKYGNKIKLLPKRKENIGLIENFIKTIKACDGKYISICDGDDYWIDNEKLQKQVGFLESNDDYSIVFSPIKKMLPNGELIDGYRDNINRTLTIDDLIVQNFIPSVSSMFRNLQDSETIPHWFNRFPYGDWPTYLWTIKDGGKIYCIEDTTAVYRFNIGESSKVEDFDEVDIEILKLMYADKSFKRVKGVIIKGLARKYLNLMAKYNRLGKHYKALEVLFKLILNYPKKNYTLKMYLYSLKLSITRK